MIEAIVVMLAIGGTCGAVLSLASKIFYVYEDPRIAEIEGLVAGANCGGCGYPGCGGAAAAVVAGKAGPGVCVIADMETAINVAGVMGIDPGSVEPQKSVNACLGGDRADDKFIYNGVISCSAMAAFSGGKGRSRKRA